MCALVPWKILIIAAGIITIVIFTLLCWLGDTNHITGYCSNAYKAASYSTIMLLILLGGGWKYVWTQQFNTWLFPKIEGEYTGTLISNYNGRTEIPNVTLTIKQSFITGMSVKQQSGESISYSKSAQLIRNGHGDFELHYVFGNDPINAVRDRSQPHLGVAILHIKQQDGNLALEGRYFNDRNFAGDMSFTFIK